MTATKDRLAEALTQVGLKDMAEKAAGGYYDDFQSPLDLPEIQLIDDLYEAARDPASSHVKAAAILELRSRVMDGEFDATVEESQAWFDSPEGREAFETLIRDLGEVVRDIKR